jgi:hypothetical protein
MPIVQIGNDNVEFPDSMSDDDIAAAIKKINGGDTTSIAAQPEQKKGFLDTVLGGIKGFGSGFVDVGKDFGKPIIENAKGFYEDIGKEGEKTVQREREGGNPLLQNIAGGARVLGAAGGRALGAATGITQNMLENVPYYKQTMESADKAIEKPAGAAISAVAPIVKKGKAILENLEPNDKAILDVVANSPVGLGELLAGMKGVKVLGKGAESIADKIPEAMENTALNMAGRGRRVIGKTLEKQRDINKTILEEHLPKDNGAAADEAGKRIGNVYHELKNGLADIKGNPETQIDHLQIARDAVARAKAKDYSGNLTKYDQMGNDIEQGIESRFGKSGISDIADAQVEKEAIGHNQFTPTDDQREAKIFNELYFGYKKAIEEAAARGGNEEVQALNKRMSQLIDARVSLAKRATVEERNNIIPLDRYVGFAAAAASGSGLPLALPAAQSLMKSKGLAQILYDASKGAKGLTEGLKTEIPLPKFDGKAKAKYAELRQAEKDADFESHIGETIKGQTASKESVQQQMIDAIRGLRPQITEEQARREAMRKILTGGGSGKKKLFGNERGSVGAEMPQTKSDNFKQWFGDWQNDPENASKVVDESGKPLVVYHGAKENFNTFDASKAGKNYGIEGGAGFFINKKDIAEHYGDNVMESYVDIKNPYTIDMSRNFSRGDNAIDYYDNRYEKILENAYEEGADGIIIHDRFGQTMVIPFSPTQIKSATGNSGKFSKTNPDIRGASPVGTMLATGGAALGGLTLAEIIKRKSEKK